jgi:thermitase
MLTNKSGIRFAEPDRLRTCDQVTPNDTSWSSQWALPKINAPAAWAITLGSSAVKAAVLDTGWDTNHPDLVDKVVAAKDFTIANGSPDTVEDGHGHGTHTAGTVAAISNNGLAVASIGWNTSLMIGKVLSDSGNGSDSEVANGIIWAGDNGAKVCSMSLGGSGTSQTMQAAIEYTFGKNCFVVASAGNNGNTNLNYPAAYEPCMAVASTTSTDARSSFSTYGNWVDIAAPGSSIISTYNNGGTATLSGTSMACPHVAGLAALVWSRGAPHMKAVRQILVKTGVPVTSGFGSFPLKRIDAQAAVRSLF